jgi:hypothetical protein
MRIKFTYIFAIVSMGLASLAFTVKPQDSWTEISMNEYDKIMEKAATFFEGKTPFSLDVQISSFKTHTDKSAYETQSGYFIRSGNNYHQYMLGMHTIQNKTYKFVLDSAEKNIMVAAPAGQKDDDVFFAEYKQFKSKIKKVEKIEANDIQKLKVTFNDKFKVARMEIELDKTGMIKKSTTFFGVKVAEDPTDVNSPKSTPRLETIILNYKAGVKPDYEKEFSEASYFAVINGKLTGVKSFRNYYIKDTRIKPTK